MKGKYLFKVNKINLLKFNVVFYFIKAESGPIKKRLKTTDTHDENNDKSNENGTNEDEEIEKNKGEIFKHVKESKEGDTETLDAATNVSKI